MRVVGLTGGIGSGKSTVARRLTELGAAIVDADKLGHGAYLPGGPAYDDVVAAFGREIVAPDGTIDRKALGARVFAEPDALARLNAIVHPRIAQAIGTEIERIRRADPRKPIVVEAAVLLEAGWQTLVDEVWVVVAPPVIAIERIVASRGLTAEDAAKRIAAQLSNEERTRAADRVIVNQGSVEALTAAVDAAFAERLAR